MVLTTRTSLSHKLPFAPCTRSQRSLLRPLRNWVILFDDEPLSIRPGTCLWHTRI